MLLDGERWEPISSQYQIIVSKQHCFNTDTILLAHFASPRKKDFCADFGTGCGTIPLIWSSRYMPRHIYAVELQDNACSMVQRTLQKNNLEANITLIHQDLTTLKPGLTPFTQELDLIACNPPYQEAGTGLVNSDDSKRIARHEGACTPDDICRVASKLLKYGGKLCMCQRPQRLFDIMESMKKVGIMPKRLRLVQQRLSKAPSLFLLEGRKGGNSGMIVEPVLMIEDENGAFSDEMLQIYGDYKQGKREQYGRKVNRCRNPNRKFVRFFSKSDRNTTNM